MEVAESERTAAEVELTDGREGTYDLVAGFLGIRSPALRRGARSKHAGYVIWRVTIPRPPEAALLRFGERRYPRAKLVRDT